MTASFSFWAESMSNPRASSSTILCGPEGCEFFLGPDAFTCVRYSEKETAPETVPRRKVPNKRSAALVLDFMTTLDPDLRIPIRELSPAGLLRWREVRSLR